MISRKWWHLPVVIGFGVSGTAGCASLGPQPPERAGPAPRWSLTGPSEETAAMAGGTLVLEREGSVRGVDPRTGVQRWRIVVCDHDDVRIAGDLVALEQGGAAADYSGDPDGPVTVSMIDPANGRRLWKRTADRLRVTASAVFTNDCVKEPRCTITRRNPRTGHAVWRKRSGPTKLGDVYVGTREPFAPPTGRYIASDFAPRTNKWGARNTATGKHAAGHVPDMAWYALTAGRTLISTDHDPPSGDDRCTVRMVAVDAVTGKSRWKGRTYSGREEDGTCQKSLSPMLSLELIGAGARIAASTADDRPQLFDLRTGRTVWRGDAEGIPIDGDGHGVLVRAHAAGGPLRYLDFATGRTRWTAPDPGSKPSQGAYETAVSQDLVAVSASTGDGLAYVLVYRADSGKRVGRFPGYLTGLGDHWVAIAHSGEDVGKTDRMKLDYMTL